MLIGIILVLGISATGCGNKKPTLNVYNWGGDYMDPSVIKDFEKEFGVKVNYNTFATNEDMYVSLKKKVELVMMWHFLLII